MRWRLTVCALPLAVVALGFAERGASSAPLMQRALGADAGLFQRADAQRPSNNPLRHCLTRKGAPSCRHAAKPDKNATAPQLSDFPRGQLGSGATADALPLPNSPPPAAAGRTTASRRVERPAPDPQTGAPSPGVKFTGGMGVPTNRAALEGTLSPYQQPNGNTSASQSGKITNGLENEGMHFGLEFHY
jgi:hypothetical protein